jgi:predicted HicB family RNase H-like nuclease
MDDLKRFTLRLEPDKYRTIKVLAAKTDTNVNTLLNNIIDKFLETLKEA